jgi:DNA-3-methyladenine glycosylase
MFGPPGFAYVYLVYGMYHCLNVVTEADGYPAAVLLRALEPVEGLAASASGPGRLCRALGIDLACHGADLTDGSLYLAAGAVPTGRVVAGPRVGVDYAGDWTLKPYRFYLADNLWVSRVPRRTRARPRRVRAADPVRPASGRTRAAGEPAS